MKRGLGVLLLALSISWIDPYHDEVSKGNERFHQKRYSDSKKHYREASRYAPNENERRKLKFNEGDTSYMTGDYENAITNFSKSLRSEDREVQKKAFFNMGNSYLRMGRYKDAIDAYISALRIDPNYENAKKNLEFLMREKKQRDRKGKGGERGKNENDKENEDINRKKGDSVDKTDRQDRGRDKSGGMSREQFRNILESMKKKPVRRKKGGDDGTRMLEKNW
jgi:Ca-activated chloride channel family protein